MTNAQTAAQHTAQNADQKKDVWPQHFGTVETVDLRHGNNGRYVILTVQGKTQKYTAFAFQGDVIEKILAAGEGARVWFKGPMEAVKRKHKGGGQYTERQMKIVYFKDKSAGAAEAPEAAEAKDETPVVAEPQDLTAIKGIGAAVAEQLTAAGITNYAELAVAEAEALDAVKAGMGKRAANGEWQAQAQALLDEAKAAAEAEANAKIDDEIPF